MDKPETRIAKFLHDQLSVWPMAADNYRALKKVKVKNFTVGGLDVTLQFNPARKISSEARLDKNSISRRPCFLCPENRPKEQHEIDFEGRKGRKYRITLNPFPIFPSHIVISSIDHTPQAIAHRYPDMLAFVSENPEYTCYYNGPMSGASAPDHMHFQGCPTGLMPLERKADEILAASGGSIQPISTLKDAELFHLDIFTNGIFLLRGNTPKSVAKLFYRLLDCASFLGTESEGQEQDWKEVEPKINLITWIRDGEFRSLVIFRSKHRPHNYFSEGEDHLHMSPGCADMGGTMVAPELEDFEKMTPELLSQVVSEVSISKEDEKSLIWKLTRPQATLEVGIMSAVEIEFEIISDGMGPQKVEFREGKLSYNGVLYDELTFDAITSSTMFAEPTFILYGVTIGKGFHWERKVDQKFAGRLKFIVDSGKVAAVDVIGVEDYLLSVISSEMKATASLEFLKAHAVISRSWVLAQIRARKSKRASEAASLEKKAVDAGFDPREINDITKLSTLVDERLAVKEQNPGNSYVRWFDHDDHELFDVCADDHCQRYQGLTMAVGENVRKAIDQTWGLVMMSGGEICDARFSKCCGGRMELFSTCWEDKDYPYLQALPDTPDEDPDGDPFCETDDEAILSQVLNDYDLETKDFYRWHVEYTNNELTDLVEDRSGMGFGKILALIPIERGPSGRIKKLRIIGKNNDLVVGKELIIRRFLSSSHLKSSAFTIHYLDKDGVEIPSSDVEKAAMDGRLVWKKIRLDGSGWGHGVGLCQIGAAVMAAKGYGFEAILSHYYPGAELKEISDLQ